jgi:PAS domain S-box-containing protein
VSREIWRSLSEPEVVAMLDRVTDGVAVLDSAWRFGYVNEPAAELLRRTREELLGRSIWSQFPDPAAGEPFLRSFEEAVHERRAATVTAFYPPLSRWFESRCFPCEDTLLVMFRDITGRRLVEEQLREYTDRMSEAERIAQFGVWRWELGSARVRWSDELHRIYGVAPGEFGGTVEAFISFLHPDDRERVWNAIDRAVVKLEPFASEERIVRADGQTRVLFSQGRVIAGPDGTAAALVGVCHDVTERSEAERDETVLIRDGEERTYVTVTFALPDAAGRPVETCTIGTDVTERRERESQRQERRDWAHRIESALREDRMLVCAQPVVDLASGEPEGYELLVRLQVGDDPGAILQPAAFLPRPSGSASSRRSTPGWWARRWGWPGAWPRGSTCRRSRCATPTPAPRSWPYCRLRPTRPSGSCSRSPRPPPPRSSTPPRGSPPSSRGSAAACRSTISAPASARSPTCACCRCATSRSTARSSRGCPGHWTISASCAASSASPSSRAADDRRGRGARRDRRSAHRARHALRPGLPSGPSGARGSCTTANGRGRGSLSRPAPQ